MKLNNENKQVKDFSDANYFDFGVHQVKIGMIELTEKGGKECVEVTVLGEDGQEDTAVVWFSTDKAANYSFNTLRQIYVHNAPEDKKDAARDTIDAVSSTEELVEKLNDKLIGGECWFTKYPDPTRTYKAKDGTVRQSVNKNIYGYPPKPRADVATNNTTPVQQAFPDGQPATGEAAEGIPSSW